MEIKIDADHVTLFKAIAYSIAFHCKTDEEQLIETSSVVDSVRKYLLAK